MNQQHPTSIQWQTLLDITEPVFLSPLIKENNFDMDSGYSKKEYVCETVLCVGGWLAVAFGIMTPTFNEYDFRYGADHMARLLGFHWREELERWAFRNAGIWGCGYGDEMFLSKNAYKKANKLSDVWRHWEGVRDRTIEWEEKNL